MTAQAFDWLTWLDTQSADEASWFFVAPDTEERVWLCGFWASSVALAEALACAGAPLPVGGLQAMVRAAIYALAHEAPADASASDDAGIAVDAALVVLADLPCGDMIATPSAQPLS